MKILKLVIGHKEYNFSHGVNIIVGDRCGAFKQALYTALGFHIFGKTFPFADTSTLQNVYAFSEENTDYFIGYDINSGNKLGFLKGTANGENLTPKQFYRAFYSNFIQEECCLFVNRYDFARYTGCCGHSFDEICGYGDILKYYHNYFSERGGRHSAFNMYQFEHFASDHFSDGVRLPSVPFYDNRLFMSDDFSLYLGDKNGVNTDISLNEQAIFDLMCLVNIGKIAERFYYKKLKPLLIFGLDKSRLLDLGGVLNYAANSGRQVFLFTENIQMITRLGFGCRINNVE
ncbi:MAG: hypothetical protein LUD27_07715 [Clostridia bacterium]|nr:hypothetical protein [Clostridia bacterium]